jgi:hypothetical protein
VCGACSFSRLVLPHLSLTTPARVCDKCVKELGSGSNSNFDSQTPASAQGKRSRASQSASGSAPVSGTAPTGDWESLLGVLEVPAWTYAVKPFTSHGSDVRIGRTVVRIIAGRSLACPPGATKPEADAAAPVDEQQGEDAEAAASATATAAAAAAGPAADPYRFSVTARINSNSARTTQQPPVSFATVPVSLALGGSTSSGSTGAKAVMGGRRARSGTVSGAHGAAPTEALVCDVAFGQDMLFDVSSGTESLQLQVVRHTRSKVGARGGAGPAARSGGSGFVSEVIGIASLPLRELQHQNKVALWLPLVPVTGDEGEAIDVADAVAHAPQSAAAGDGAGGSGGSPDVLEDPSNAPAICIEAQYIYNALGSFWAQLLPADAGPDNRPFHFSRFFRDFFVFLFQIQPVLWLLDCASPVISWRSPVVSAVVLAVLFYLTLNPWAILVLLHIFLLRHLMLRYIEHKAVAANDKGAQGVSLAYLSDVTPQDAERIISLCPSARQAAASANASPGVATAAATSVSVSGHGTRSPVPPLPLVPNPTTAEADAALIGVLSGMFDRLLPLCGTGSTLAQVDRALAFANSKVFALRRLLAWHDPAATGAVFVTALAGLIWSFFASQAPLYLAIGLVVLLMRTAPMVFIIKLLQSLGGFISRG